MYIYVCELACTCRCKEERFVKTINDMLRPISL